MDALLRWLVFSVLGCCSQRCFRPRQKNGDRDTLFWVGGDSFPADAVVLQWRVHPIELLLCLNKIVPSKRDQTAKVLWNV